MQRPYIHCMKNLLRHQYPTPAELYALEQKARRLRASEIARLFRAAAKSWQALWSPKAAKGLRHA
jgi:hypothetical protein